MPKGAGRPPVVLVISEIFGVHEYIRDVCRRLGKLGYCAIAPELFARLGDPRQLSSVPEILARITSKTPDAQVMSDLDATVAWAAKHGADTGRLAITGFCWGGRITWLYCAHSSLVRAGVAWYGRLAPSATATEQQVAAGRPWPVDLAGDLKAPVLGLYGGQDQGIPVASVETLRAALAREGAQGSDIRLYPEAPHGFHADYRASYRPEEAADGWRRLLAHFDAYLKG